MIFRRKNQTPAIKPIARAASRPVVENPGVSEPSAPRGKVLVVDDDPVVVRALAAKLQSSGFAVLTASDGSQALNATRKERPDAMLLDVHFPPDVAHGGGVPWNGFLITEWLRRLDVTTTMPVILISASDRPEYPQKASDVGAAAFLPKPVDTNMLLNSIETALLRKKELVSERPASAPARQTEAEVVKSECVCSDAVAAQSSAIEFGL